MNLCSDGHDEVCFEGRKCPVCDTKSDMQKTIDGLEKTVSELQNVLQDMTETQNE